MRKELGFTPKTIGVGIAIALVATAIIWAPAVFGTNTTSLVKVLAGVKAVKTSGEVREGGRAPDFQFRDQNGGMVRLSDYQSKWVFLYFNPKDDSLECTSVAKRIRDQFPGFEKKGVQVLEIYIDDMASHGKITRKYDHPFMLSANIGKNVMRQYGADGTVLPVAMRVSFLIDPNGFVARIYDKGGPAVRASEVLRDVAMLEKPI